jgi:MFS family permease
VEEERLRYAGWRVVAASSVGVFFAAMPFYAFAVFLKPLTAAFGWTREAVSAGYGTMALCTAIAGPAVGYLLDRLGPRRVIVPSMAVSAVTVLSLAALSPHHWHLLVAFGVIGIATIGASPVAHSRVIFSWFDRRRGSALAIMLAGAAASGIVIPPIAQQIIQRAGWRWAWLTLGAMSLAIAVPAVARFVRSQPGPAARQAGADGATVHVALRSRLYWTLLIVVFGSTVAANGMMVHLAALLSDRGFSAERAALAVSAAAAGSLTGRLLTGWLIDRLPAPRVACGLLLIASIGIAAIGETRSFAVAVVGAALMGFGTGGELDITPYLISRYFGMRSLSTLYGLTWSALGAAGALGPVLLGRAFDRTGDYASALTELALLTLAMGALMLTLPGGRASFPCQSEPSGPPASK